MSEDMSERMPKDTSERMSEDMSERMPKDMSERMSKESPLKFPLQNGSARADYKTDSVEASSLKFTAA